MGDQYWKRGLRVADRDRCGDEGALVLVQSPGGNLDPTWLLEGSEYGGRDCPELLPLLLVLGEVNARRIGGGGRWLRVEVGARLKATDFVRFEGLGVISLIEWRRAGRGVAEPESCRGVVC